MAYWALETLDGSETALSSSTESRARTLPPTSSVKKERKKTDNPREGWEDGTPPPHRDFKERRVWC